MELGRGHWKYLLLTLVLIMVLTACERPMASNDNDASQEEAEATVVVEPAEDETTIEEEAEVDEPAEEADESDAEAAEEEAQQEPDEETEAADEGAAEAESEDPEVGGGTPETAADEADLAEESDAAAESAEESEGESAEMTDEAVDSEEDTAEVTEEEAAAADDETESDTAEEPAEPEAESQQTLPATHTVAPGENLYRIGLKYGMSWVTLAAYNNLPNANYIRVGQVLQIPSGGEPAPDPTPVPDAPAYVDYVVQRGDTLYSIGRKFGVSWVEIAEANGIVNPNLIYAGQVLKIPTGQPETPPSVTHTVKSGETLYRISLQYGVHWLAIAQANSIAPPYVIYPGQVLIIPSG